VPELHSKNTEKNWQTYVITDLQHIIVVNHRKALKQYTTRTRDKKFTVTVDLVAFQGC